MLLPWLILIPFIGGFLCWQTERFGVKMPRWIALITMGLTLALGLQLWLQGVLPATTELEHGRVLTLEITSGVVAIAGILIAAWLWLGKRTLVTAVANSAPGRLLGTWWYNAWGFDWLYDMIFVKPFLGIAWLLKRDPLNSLMNIPAILSRFAGKGLLLSENGYLRWYVASMSIGAVVVLALLMVLR